MSFTDVINDYTLGATGTLADSNGQDVNYTVTDGAQTINIANHGNFSARITGQGSDSVVVTFDVPVVGASLTFQGSDNNEFYNAIVDGVVVDLNALVASGDVTLVNAGSVASHTVNADGTISGGSNADGSIGQLIFNFPITSLGAVGFNSPSSGNFDGVEVGIESATFDVICFASGTNIMTPTGARQIEELKAGDMVVTVDNGIKPVLWKGVRSFKDLQDPKSEALRPVRIIAGALGNGLPQRDLLVSRQHRILVRSKVAQRMFGAHEVLIPAIKLTALPGIHLDKKCAEITYVHVLLDAHEMILAEGTPAESLYTGAQALRSVPLMAKQELMAIFPELAGQSGPQEFIRKVPHIKKQTELVKRHRKNKKPILDLHSTGL